MEAYESIITRRSIRQYKKDKISDLLCEKLLHAAMQAPSAHNSQAWHFVLIDDRRVLQEIPDFHPYAKMLYEAPLAIAVCGDRKKERSVEYLALNCAAATENILLAAHALDLGAVWLGIYPRKDRMAECNRLFQLPEYIIPISLVAIGYPEEKKRSEYRYEKSLIHHNKW
jgi:nitroreductase